MKSKTLHILGVICLLLAFAAVTPEAARSMFLIAVLFFCSGSICRALENLADTLPRTTEKQSETAHEWHKVSEEG